MKKIIYFLLICFIEASFVNAQVDLQNTGTLYIAGSTDTFFVNGNFTNTSSAALSNYGKVYIKQNFTNSQTSWTIGTGEIILNGTGAQLISSAASSPFYKLTINKSTGLSSLSSAVIINNTLTLTAGKLSLDNFDVTIGKSGNISGAGTNTYLVATGSGELKQQVVSSGSKLFPIGTSAVYTPATIALTPGSTTDIFSMRMLTAFYSLGTSGTALTSNAVNSTWMIAEAVAGGSDASLTLQWPLSLELSGFDRTFSRVAHYISAAWEYGFSNIAASGSNPYTVIRSGITSFSPFGVAMNMALLPVTWLELSGKNNGDENNINWSTGTETNNAYFSVEASVNGISFVEVGRVAGAVNSNTIQTYNFVHKNINGQSFYYRIKQTDVDGTFVYSKIIRVDAASYNWAVLYPNPVKYKTTISFSLKETTLMTIAVCNASGQVVYSSKQLYYKGDYKTELDLSTLPAASYTLQIKNEKGSVQMIRFIKTN